MLLGTRLSRVVSASKPSVKTFVLLLLVISSLPTLGLSLMIVLDCGSTACFRFVRNGALGFGGEDGRGAEGIEGDRGADGADQF